MPFSQLPSLNLQLPRANIQPLPTRIPNQKGLLIAEALARFLPEAMKGLDPRERLRRQNEELEYKMNLQKYEYLKQHPELLSGKSTLDDVRRRQMEQSIIDSKSRVDERNRKNQPGATWNSQKPPDWDDDKLLPKPTTMIDLGQIEYPA